MTDGNADSTNPLEASGSCWVGWKKENVSKPSITIELTRQAPLTSLILRTFIDENMGASAIKRFHIRTKLFFGLGTLPDYIDYEKQWLYSGYVCAPKKYYHISPQVVDFEFDLEGIKAQFITINMEYSGDIIFVRQVTLKQGKYGSSELHVKFPYDLS